MTQLDTLSTQQASIQKSSEIKEQLITESEVQQESEVQTVSDTPMITDEDVADEVASSDDLSQLPWDEIEENWKNTLKEFLVSVEPERAEEMFQAYMEEKKKYTDRVDFTDVESGVQDSSALSEEPIIEGDSKEGELERLHSENLKEIFGDHYSQVENLHKEYIDSVQYLNRSSVKFTISL